MTGAFPVVGITTWRRQLTTYLGPGTDLHTIGVEYLRPLEAVGVQPVLLASPHSALAVIDRIDGLVLSGGDDVHPDFWGGIVDEDVRYDRERDSAELQLVLAARNRNVPVLGICRGLQVIGVAHDAKLISDLPHTPEHPRSSDPASILGARQVVHLEPGSRVAKIFCSQSIVVNSIHHQALAEAPEGFRISARADDGAIEAIEAIDPHWYCLGVQWHPEKMTVLGEPETQLRLFKDFADAASRFAHHARSGETN